MMRTGAWRGVKTSQVGSEEKEAPVSGLKRALVVDSYRAETATHVTYGERQLMQGREVERSELESAEDARGVLHGCLDLVDLGAIRAVLGLQQHQAHQRGDGGRGSQQSQP